MTRFADAIVDVASSFQLIRRSTAPQQAGIFVGLNPTVYNSSDPLPLWVIQVVIIVCMTQFLALILSRIRQPRVIAEVIGGVILGPSVMGHIPNFNNAIFPSASIPVLTLTSTVGLVLFLFIVGLEIDFRLVKRNIKSSSAISIAGLVVPLGLGAALGVPIYHQFVDPSINFGYFLLFTAVAIGITAFPVLCRILTEVKLLETTVGVVVLSAGVGNDVIGWVLLALTVALVNATSGVVAVYVLLTGAAFALFLLVPVRLAFVWLAKRTGSLESGQPTTLMMTITLMIVFVSAFFTDIIGIHPIFGGFLAGLVIPHENGFSIAVVEKLEDLISIIFLPLYFALSGLRTDLGLLNNGITWGYTILICVVAFFSKFLACGGAARLAGFTLRESGAIGSLMSCKGLVELIVLNVGLDAGILNTRTFSMFVLHALILTFMTTPLTLLFYPPKYRKSALVVNEKSPGDASGLQESGVVGVSNVNELKTKFALILDRMEQLPAAMTLTQLLRGPSESSPSNGQSHMSPLSEHASLPAAFNFFDTATTSSSQITIDALRLIELTNRTSAVLKSQASEALLRTDSLLSVFRTFGHLSRVPITASLSVVGYDEFPSRISQYAEESGAQMVILPWCRNAAHDVAVGDDEIGTHLSQNPFDSKAGGHEQTSSTVAADFIRRVFASSPTDVALFVERAVLPMNSTLSSEQHLFLPFFGGPDDRLALSFVVQMCMNPSVTATVVKITKTASDGLSMFSSINETKFFSSHENTSTFPDTVYAHSDTQTRLSSDTADNLIWDHFTSQAHSRISFRNEHSPRPLHTTLSLVADEIRTQASSGRSLIVVLGRSRRMAPESHVVELKQIFTGNVYAPGREVAKTLGDVGATFVAAGTNASMLVLQAKLA